MFKNKKTRCKIELIIGLLLLIAGLLLFALPYVNELRIRSASRNVDIKDLTSEKLKDNLKSEANFNFDTVSNISVSGTWGSVNAYNEANIIGQLVIPKLDMNLILFKGLDEASLVAGVGTMKPDEVMGQGNYCIAGHRAILDGVLFHNLTDAKLGQEIRLTDKSKIYIYKVANIEETNDEAIYMLEDKRMSQFGDKPIITLMTCHWHSKETRFFVTGVLEKVIDYDPDKMVQIENLG